MTFGRYRYYPTGLLPPSSMTGYPGSDPPFPYLRSYGTTEQARSTPTTWPPPGNILETDGQFTGRCSTIDVEVIRRTAAADGVHPGKTCSVSRECSDFNRRRCDLWRPYFYPGTLAGPASMQLEGSPIALVKHRNYVNQVNQWPPGDSFFTGKNKVVS